MAIRIERKEHGAAELRRLACRAGGPAQARRMLATALVMKGADRATAARSCGMDRQTLRDWVHRYNAEGVAGLEGRLRPGRPPRLPGGQADELIAVVEAGPDPAVGGVVRWRSRDPKGVIVARFAVALSERSVGRLLNDRGHVRLKPRPRHAGVATPEEQAAFKKRMARPVCKLISPRSPRRHQLPTATVSRIPHRPKQYAGYASARAAEDLIVSLLGQESHRVFENRVASGECATTLGMRGRKQL